VLFVIIYKNEDFNKLCSIARGQDVLRELKELDSADGGRRLDSFADNYEDLSKSLDWRVQHSVDEYEKPGEDLEELAVNIRRTDCLLVLPVTQWQGAAEARR
jgi:hypothetical protein